MKKGDEEKETNRKDDNNNAKDDYENVDGTKMHLLREKMTKRRILRDIKVHLNL